MKTLRIAPHSLQQHPNYRRTVNLLGGHCENVLLSASGAAAGRVQIVRRKFANLPVAWMARGPIWDEKITRDQKRLALNSPLLKGLSLAIPETPKEAKVFRACGYRAVITAQHFAEIDLLQSRPARLAAQHGKWRNRLQHAFRQPAIVTNTTFNETRHADLLALEQAQRNQRRYQALPAAFTKAWAKANQKDVRLFCANTPSGLCAFMIILLHAPGATYHIGWSDDSGRRLSAHTLLLWEASNWLAEKGFTRFDLGSVDTQSAPGIARFKLGSGASLRSLGPTMLRLPRPRLRRIYRAA